jgi:hypothetical protein
LIILETDGRRTPFTVVVVYVVYEEDDESTPVSELETATSEDCCTFSEFEDAKDFKDEFEILLATTVVEVLEEELACCCNRCALSPDTDEATYAVVATPAVPATAEPVET